MGTGHIKFDQCLHVKSYTGIAMRRHSKRKRNELFVNPLQYQNLILSLGSKVQYVNVNMDDCNVGFSGVRIYGPAGECTVISDMNCIPGYGYALEMRTWECATLGKLVNLFRGDGLDMIRSSTNDSLQFRCFSYGNLACYAPGFNGVCYFGNGGI